MMYLNYKEILDRLKSIKKFKTDEKLASALAVAPNTLSTWRARNKGDINKILSLCEHDTDLNWLIFGSEKKHLRDQFENNISKSEFDQYMLDKKNKLPLIPLNAIAGISKGNTDVIPPSDCDFYDVPEFKNRADYLIRISGTSMTPKYQTGDVVACKKIPIDTFFQWNMVYVLDTDQGALIKRVKRSGMGDEYIQLVSENEKYEPFDIKRTSIYALALVIGVIRLQ